ncbi:uncharacterized protein LOC107017240 [Solanum pennellii]|uniref:Uncharacterized protein LOC107017240 n=1 Tax=Solanum pennellii TaxID=28526 RepID=A0ABM1GLT6_SOLPN|nr:uncharacterized protein LOC107017240 [Solanum pennellii]
MALNGKLLRTSKQMGLGNNNGGQNQYYSLMNNYSLRFKCLNKGRLIGGAEKKVVVATKAAGTAVVSEPITTQNWKISDVSLVADNVSDLIFQNLKNLLKQMPQKLHHLQSSIEKGILDCRFFSLLAVAGTLIGSLLCFIEGCYLIIESYIHYFIAISHKSDLGHVVQLLIEAIDMFLLGTAMLTFGMGLYVMFVGSRNINVKGDDDDQLSGKKLYYFQTLPSLMGMKSVMQAKARIGHALIMLLQVGVLEKFKNIPVVNGLDLACFAAAVFVSSICVFILSRLAVTNTKAGD